MILHLDETNFKDAIAEGIVVVDFWAPWCGPCKAMNPVIEKVAQNNADLKVAKVNIDESPHIAREFNILSIPTIIIYKDGVPREQTVGIVNESMIMGKVRSINNP
jgi:thioredoxin 1